MREHHTRSMRQSGFRRTGLFLSPDIYGRLDTNTAVVLFKFVSVAQVLSKDFIIMVVYNGISEEENAKKSFPNVSICAK